MKFRILLALVVSLTAQIVFADQPSDVYAYKAKLSYATDGKVASCPNIERIVITDTGRSGNVLVQTAGSKEFSYLGANGEDLTCMSDIVCETTAYYKTETHPLKISIVRNNDGGYPTTNLPGFSRMSVDLSDVLSSASTYCYYDLQ